MKSPKNIEKLIRNAEIRSNPDVNQTVLENLLKQFDFTEQEQEAFVAPPNKRKTIMKNPITKIAAAALIVTAVLIAINQFGGSTTGVAWGEVVRNIEANPGFVYQMRQTHINKETGTKEFYMKVYGSAEYGVRMDGYLDPEHPVQTYVSRKKEALISIMHSSKTYIRQPLTGEQMAELERLDPKECVGKLLSVGYRKLGRKTINGIEAEGVEITNPEGARISSDSPIEVDSLVAQLWVAVETGLPIFFESKTICNNGTKEFHTVQDEFQWNVELDASEFEPNLPADYIDISP